MVSEVESMARSIRDAINDPDVKSMQKNHAMKDVKLIAEMEYTEGRKTFEPTEKTKYIYDMVVQNLMNLPLSSGQEGETLRSLYTAQKPREMALDAARKVATELINQELGVITKRKARENQEDTKRMKEYAGGHP